MEDSCADSKNRRNRRSIDDGDLWNLCLADNTP